MGRKRVTFDAYPDSPFRYVDYDAVICINVLLDTTTLATAVEQGRRAFLAADIDHAQRLASSLGDVLFAGATNGNGSARHMQIVPNSPASLSRRSDTDRPLILVSGVGTETILNAAGCSSVYVACFRNLHATALAVAERCSRVAVLAACSYRQLRCEDLMAAARVADELCSHGLEAEDDRTESLMSRWSQADLSLVRLGSTAEHLRSIQQAEDLDFVLDHIDDLPLPLLFRDGEVMAEPQAESAEKPVRALSFPARSSSVPADIGIAMHAAADSRGH